MMKRQQHNNNTDQKTMTNHNETTIQQPQHTHNEITIQQPQQNNTSCLSAFRNAKCSASYLFWESPCRYLTFIWHFEMFIKCNANISIPGAMQNANVMQM